MITLDHDIGGTRIIFLGLLLAYGLPAHADDYVLSTLGETPTEGWDGPGTGSATINYYLGWSGAPSNNGLTFGSLTRAQVEAELANATATWSAVVDVTFNYLGNAVDNPGLAADPWGTPGNETLVLFSHGTELANSYPFDGAGLTTVFAHSWGPPDIMGGTPYEFAGNIHMDADENWLTGLADGTTYTTGVDLETLFLHQLGHSLGLGDIVGVFAEPGGSIMAEHSYLALTTLGAGDIAGIRQLYSFQGQDWSNGDPSAPPDVDGDGVPNDGDLCSGTAVSDPVDASGCSVAQVDVDEDGHCDIDAPSSGPDNCLPTDNCPTVFNPDQLDANMDGFGDACVDPSVVIPPSADVDPTVTVGPDTSINKNVSVGANSEIGADVDLNRGTSVGSDVDIDDGASLGKSSFVGDGASIGPGVVLGQGVYIGPGVVIGADSVIGKSTVFCSGGTGDDSDIGKNNFVTSVLPALTVLIGVNGATPDPASCP